MSGSPPPPPRASPPPPSLLPAAGPAVSTTASQGAEGEAASRSWDVATSAAAVAASPSRTDARPRTGNSVIEAVYHVICVVAGSGILQLPFALNQSGWVGVAIIVFAAFANSYSGLLLVKCLYSQGNKRLKGFAHIGQVAFGERGRIFVEGFSNTMLLGVPIVYLILSGMNLAQLVGVFSIRVWIAVSTAIVAFPFLYYRSLKEIAFFSAFGVFATVVVILTVVVYSVADLSDRSSAPTHNFPAALGSISFSYAGNFVYPEVEASMKDPQKFPRVLAISMSVISLMYIITAVVGYAAYGNATVSPILNNLPAGFVASFSIAVITAHVLAAIPVLITTFALEMERRLEVARPGRSARTESALRTALRVAVLVGITSLAMAVPFFDDFMTLLGAAANTALIFVFPVLFDFKLFGFYARPLKEKVFGLTLLFPIGGWSAVLALIDDFNGAK
ncbi:transmembrane amino acid transporter protein-domain-containing protein [Zopfochytrium polystomum]|nr:transmembrane amino acid transporter protein-domain-containing protein [Zopfochytrium polystomum]